MRHLILTFLIAIFSLATNAQTLSGRVTDEKGEPVPGATVFLTNTSFMSTTGIDGSFTLKEVQPGAYNLVIKMLGFEADVQNIIIGKVNNPLNIRLKEENKQLGEVTIAAKTKGEADCRKNLQLFTKAFIGETANADQCKILNPEVLHFTYNVTTDMLMATATKMIQVQNMALGYQLNYLLTSFKFSQKNETVTYSGYPYFENLNGTPAQQSRWAKNRLATLSGSIQYFFNAAYTNTLDEKEFAIYITSGDESPHESADLSKIFVTAAGGYKKLNLPVGGVAWVFHKGGREPYRFLASGLKLIQPEAISGGGQLSKISPLVQDVLIGPNGPLAAEKSFTLSGFWSWTKIADLLPIDFVRESSGQPKQADDTQTAPDNNDGLLGTEHIYLHLNKPRYERADTIWFKLYDVTDSHRLSAISKTPFAELISPQDSIIQRLNLRLEAGMASGDFSLPLTLPAGTYRIRAYTNWMKNQGEGGFYNRRVVIGNPGSEWAMLNSEGNAKRKLTTPTTTTSPTTTDLQFFPEGGEMIEGLRNVVAFKATNPDGTAAVLSGTVTGIDGQIIAELQINNLGTGQFAINPQPNENYAAHVTFADGKTQTFNLPKAVVSGYTLTINNHDKDTVTIKIAANTEMLKTATGKGFYLVAQSAGKVYYTTSGKTDATAYKIKIAKDRFPTGITRFTLFAGNGEPLNERVVFIQNRDNLDLQLDKKSAESGEQIINITSLTQKDQTATVGSFSAAVFNEDMVPFDERTEPTILTSLLLNNELHGEVVNVKRYLADANDMDLLMLTQGYRKLEWKKADSVKQPSLKEYQNEDGLTIAGVVTDNKGKPVAGGKLTLFSTNPMIKLDTLTGSDGKFDFSGLDMDGKIKFALKAQNGKSDAIKISLDNTGTTKAPVFIPSSNPLPADTSASVKTLAAAIKLNYEIEEKNYEKLNSKQLKEVTIKDKYDPVKKMEELLEGSTNLNGPGHADQIVMGKDLVGMGCPIVAECLAVKLFQVEISKDNPLNPKLYNASRGAMYKDFGPPKPMIVYVDGHESTLLGITANDIYSVEVMTSAHYESIYGSDAMHGLILITTKRGIPKNELIPIEREPGLISFTYNGYYKAREFYQPKYQQGDAYQPSAIYWKPDILTDKDGKATINFNNAGKGHYRVVVEGIDGEGRLGHTEYKYEVK